ncbi:MAG: methionine--tRNA ligase, partial [Pseudomonadota bacterium]
LDNIIHIADQANAYIDAEAPWSLRKSDPEKMQQVLYSLLEISRYLGIALQAFIPDAASQMLDQLGINRNQRNFSNLTKEFALKPGSNLQEPKPIFPRL